jgi:hypothetical protein
MSVGDSFTLFPLSKFFVRKLGTPDPETNIGPILPIASGRIENDASIEPVELREITLGTVFLILKVPQIPKGRNYENI